MQDRPELSIIILCYRSEEQIIDFAQKVKTLAIGLGDSFEIILVGNYIEGSDDRTKEIVEQIAKEDDCFKTVCKPKEGMMGWDMREGFSCASGNYMCVIDGDGQFPIESISYCYETIKKGAHGLVKTYRQKREDGFYRRFISTIYNIVFSILFSKVKSKDVNSKPKILTRIAYEKMNLTSDDWFIDAEIMINVNKLGIPYTEFPVDFLELEGRKSFVKFSAILEFLQNLLVFRFKK